MYEKSVIIDLKKKIYKIKFCVFKYYIYYFTNKISIKIYGIY